MTTVLKKIAFKLRYPKLLLLFGSLFLGYLIYVDENNFHFHLFISKLGIFGTFFAGVLFAHGLTMGPAIAILFVIGQTEPFFLTGVIATVGAIIGNAITYQSLKISYNEEIEDLSNHSLFKWAVQILDKITPLFVRKYILPALAGILTATPLPDEFSAALIHASRNISTPIFLATSFVFSAFGVFIILAIEKFI